MKNKRDFDLELEQETRFIDNRDTMHKRGWTYFTISGKINNRDITGEGRICFVYSELKTNAP